MEPDQDSSKRGKCNEVWIRSLDRKGSVIIGVRVCGPRGVPYHMGLRLGIAGSPYDRGLTLSGSAYVIIRILNKSSPIVIGWP